MATLSKSLDSLLSTEATSFSLHNQRTHRCVILHSWLRIARDCNYDLESNIVGKQSLDIGCGQGDMIELFAAVLKAEGNKQSRVIGVDPASLDYGESVLSISV